MPYSIKDYTERGLAAVVDDSIALLGQAKANLEKCNSVSTSPRTKEVLKPLAKTQLQEAIKMLQDVEELL